MYKVKFDTGETVSFQNQPTDADIEDVVKKLGIKPKQATTPEPLPQEKPLPILTNEQGGVGTAIKDVSVGAGKAFVRGTRDVAGMLQGAGKAVLGAFGADTTKMGLDSLDSNTDSGKAVDETLQSRSRAEQVGTVLENVAELGTGFIKKGVPLINKAKGALNVAKEEKTAATITEMISPKPTVKEARLAQTQGRLVEGKSPTLFKAGTEDKILPSQKTLNASKTIMENIPNASKLKPTELYKAVDETISKTATELRPKMVKTPIKPETVDKINTEWEALKKSQILEAPATEEINVAKRQAKFESLLRKSGNGTHADLWDTRVLYDESIPDGVKKATSLSPESLQIQKEEWLQNRDILNSAINDNAFGMGKESQDAFAKMTNLYEAKTGLLSKAKVNEAALSKFNQFLKDNPKTAKILGGVTAYEVLKNLGVPIP